MPLFSTPLPRFHPIHPLPLRPTTPRLLCLVTTFYCSGAATPDPPDRSARLTRRPSPDKNLLKARDAVHTYLSSRSPTLDPSFGPSDLLPSQAIGLVAAAQANFMRVIVESHGPSPPEEASSSADPRVGEELLCVVRAVLKKIKRRVLVGDKVLVGAVDWVDRRGMIESVFARETELIDPPIANVDQLLVLFSMEQPKLEPFTLTRFLVEAESTGIPLMLVLNKMEIVSEEVLSSWKSRLHEWGYQPIFCSVEKKYGLSALQDIMKGKTTVIVGPSGVGKSSLINAVRGSSRNFLHDVLAENIDGGKWFEDQRVGTVSERSGRGKHTTRHVSLLPLSDGGYLADTPGFNQPHLLKVTKKSLAQTFPEIRKMLKSSDPSKCSFNDCLHIGEPGCLVKGDWERYTYYLQFLDEIKIREEFQLRTFGTKRESDVRYKMGDLGVRQAEPRLELKKHRRVSRKRLNQSILNELDQEDDLEGFNETTR